jgi:long-chain acyl-CoA synthetase
MNIVDLLFLSADRLPSHPAIIFKEQTITYAELKNEIVRVAFGLREKGFKENTNVGLMMQNSPEYIISYYALLTIGATVIPINPLFKANEVAYILNNSESVGILTDELAVTTVLAVRNEVRTLKTIVCRGAKNNLEDVLEWQTYSSPEGIFHPAHRHPNDTAHIIYTSGTTGKPKGVMITHANLNWLSITESSMLRVTPSDRVLCTLPLYHVYGNLQCMLTPFVHGATVYLKERFNTNDVLHTIDKEKITMYFGVPTMFTMLVQSPIVQELDFTSLRVCGSGGASIATEIIKKVKELMKVDILEGYGQTESTAQITMNPYQGKQKIGSAGLPIPGVEVKIVDAKNLEVIQGEVGEVLFRGPNVMKGYYNKPEETKEIFQNHWIVTGDLAYQDEEGYLYIVDRKKDLIIRGGYNVYPREIEEVLYQHTNVVECAVLGMQDDRLGEEIVAYVVSQDELNEQELREHCKKFLVHYKVPRIFYSVESLPKSTIGKILKRELRNSSQPIQ